MALNIVAQILIGVALSIVAYMMMPKPKQPKPPSVEDLGSPTAEAGRPIPLVVGSVTVESPNALWYGEKELNTRKAKGGKK